MPKPDEPYSARDDYPCSCGDFSCRDDFRLCGPDRVSPADMLREYARRQYARAIELERQAREAREQGDALLEDARAEDSRAVT